MAHHPDFFIDVTGGSNYQFKIRKNRNAEKSLVNFLPIRKRSF